MTDGEHQAIDALAAHLASFQVEIAKALVPRPEVDERFEKVDAQIRSVDRRVTRITVQVGILLGIVGMLDFAGILSLIFMVARGE